MLHAASLVHGSPCPWACLCCARAVVPGPRCVKPLKTVASFLEERNGLAMLSDPLMAVATAEIDSRGAPRGQRLAACALRPTVHLPDWPIRATVAAPVIFPTQPAKLLRLIRASPFLFL